MPMYLLFFAGCIFTKRSPSLPGFRLPGVFISVKAWRGCGDNMGVYWYNSKEWWCPKGGEIAIYRPMCG
jgi:hypothetical protein